MFPVSAPSAAPLDQIAFAAQIGFAGMQHVFATSTPIDEQKAVGVALRRHGMRAGCMLYAPFEVIKGLFVGSGDAGTRARFIDYIRTAIETAERIGTQQIAVLAAADPSHPVADQRDVLADTLCEAADLALKHGKSLCLEALASAVLPPMILERLDDAVRIIERANRRNLRLIYDTAHVQALEGDVLANLTRVFAHVEVVQVADFPGRGEPGSGQLDLESFLVALRRLGFEGLIELEHGWSQPGLEGEQRGLERLRCLDERVRRSLTTTHHVA